MDDTRRTLRELSRLLGQYGHPERATFLAALAEQAPPEILKVVAGPELWGGSGAVWEVEPFNLSDPGVAEAADDYRRFMALMIDLSEMLEAHGMSELSTRNAEFFRRGLQ